MKKIGILYGQESTFPFALIDKINAMNVPGIKAEAVQLDKVQQGATSDYAVIIDRISQDVPFYRAFLKTAAITGTAVINNPFWWSADEKFFNNSIAISVGVPVPKTYLLPSNQMPTDTNANSFRNLKYPMDWNGIVEDIGFPAYMKPHSGGGWKSVYRVESLDDLFAKHNETEQLVMMLQEEIVFEEYFRCYCIGGKYVRIMQYEPRNPQHLRYSVNTPPSSPQLLDTIRDYVLRLNQALGYDFNTVEFAVRNGVPYAIDFCNPAPDADKASVGQENFDWVVETSARYAIERALAHKPGQDNLTWGNFVRTGASGEAATKNTPVKSNATPTAPAKRGRKAAPKATASTDATAPKRRGRPAKAKVEGEVKEAKRRGRPAKAKVEGEVKEAKRRGRPAKAKVEGEVKEAKRRGRPAKAKVEGEVKTAQRRGRPAKAKVEGEVKTAQRRGRPAKAKVEGEVKEAKRRGRPAKAKVEGEVKTAERRGRPAKAKVEGEVKTAQRAGRPAKAKVEGEVKTIKARGPKPKAEVAGEVKTAQRRGRPAKAKVEGEVKTAQRRGRPAKAKVEGEVKTIKARGPKPKAEAAGEVTEVKRRGRPAGITAATDATAAMAARPDRPAKTVAKKTPKKKVKAAPKAKIVAEKKPRKAKAALTSGTPEKVKKGRKAKTVKVAKPKREKIEKPFGPLMGIDAVLAAEKMIKDNNK